MPEPKNPNVKRLPNGDVDAAYYQNKYAEMWAGVQAINRQNERRIKAQRIRQARRAQR